MRVKLLKPEGTERLQHSESRAVWEVVDWDDQVEVDEASELFERIRSETEFGGIEGEWARVHTHHAEHALIGRIQEIVGPRDRRVQRAVTIRDFVRVRGQE